LLPATAYRRSYVDGIPDENIPEDMLELAR
jgi:hypothetical protein